MPPARGHLEARAFREDIVCSAIVNTDGILSLHTCPKGQIAPDSGYIHFGTQVVIRQVHRKRGPRACRMVPICQCNATNVTADLGVASPAKLTRGGPASSEKDA